MERYEKVGETRILRTSRIFSSPPRLDLFVTVQLNIVTRPLVAVSPGVKWSGGEANHTSV